MIHVIGIGLKGKESLSREALGLIERATLVAGGARHLDEFKDIKARKLPVSGGLDKAALSIKEHIRNGGRGVAVLATGDPSLFGIADFIIKQFGKRGVRVIPNVSVAQEAFARIKENSNNVKVLSAHGRGTGIGELCEEILLNDKAAVFTDPLNPPSRIAAELLKRGGRGYTVYVAEELGTGKEKVTKGSLLSISRRKSFSALNTMILIRDKVRPGRESSGLKGFGAPDASFAHSSGMITKEEIRVIALSKLDIRRESVIWDIGSCSGSVAVEAARLATCGRVYAFEKDRARCADIRENRERFGTHNIEVVNGVAPACLKGAGIAAPDAAFVGGGGVLIGGILDCVGRRLKDGGRMVVSAVTIETAHAAFEFFKKRKWSLDMAMVSLSKAKSVGELNMLCAHNPVFLITGVKPWRP
ncbi:MAG: precorrin-6y C5,15-methyltransferase (decarboxylating) subunit CbiE [Deltaproteobacteria bacterium]|nr:precorrin-6y C5,15-methyltransferase (decarboxylating) subunit CbiE [Deltaproteobacteria bacterium]